MLGNKITIDFFQKQTKSWVRVFRLIWSVVPYWTLSWSVLLFIQGFLPVVTVYITKLTIDSIVKAVSNESSSSSINTSILLLAITGVVLVMSEIIQSLIDWVRVEQSDILTDHIKNLIHKKAVEVDYEFYESPNYYDLLEQARNDSISKPIAVLEGFGSIIQNALILLSFFTLLTSYGWWIPILLLLGTLPAMYFTLQSERKYHKWFKSTTTDRRWLHYFDTMITNSPAAAEMRLFGLNKRFRNLYQNLRTKFRQERKQHLKRQFLGKLFAGLLALLTAAVGIGWMATQILYKTASLGDLAVFYQIFSRAQSIMKSLLNSANQVINSNLYLENLFEYLDLQPKISTTNKPISFPKPIKQGIEFIDINFIYPGSKKTSIKNLNLFIPAGKLVAIVGVNGAGKSTLIKLLCRFYDPTKGLIKIDGINIKQFDIKELQNNISVLFQIPMFYHETANNNISLGDSGKEYNQDEIILAAKRANAHNLISSLPEQYESLLGKWFANGHELSGGEWQRIALARSYYRKAQILILDEPTSFMDSWSEVEWFNHLQELIVGRTGFIITHRFTIAMRADIIHVVHEGEIIESGSHQKLLESNGFYAKSWAAQMQIVDEQQFEVEHSSLYKN